MRMISSRIQGVEFVAANCDFQDLHKTGAPTKLQIGKNLSRGLGAGMNPEIGRQAAADAKEEITEALKGADMVFITAGMGGGTGTGASPIIAEIARDLGALTVAIVTRPFSFEGAQRSRIAEEGWNQLRDKVDSIITVSNDRLLSIIDRKTPILEAFSTVDDVLRQGVQGISDLITNTGIINADFADVKAVMANSGSALMGIGRASGGEDRAITAAKMAINSPLLEVAIDGAKGVLFNVAGGSDLSMAEINEAAKIITENIDPNAKVIFGAAQDDKLKKGEIKITVIATGFNGGASAVTGTAKSSGLLTGVHSNLFDDIERSPKNGESSNGLSRGRNGPEQKKEFVDHSLEDESMYEIPAFIRKKMKE